MEFKSAYGKSAAKAYVYGDAELEELLITMMERHCDLVGEIAGLKQELKFAKADLESVKNLATVQEKLLCLTINNK